MTAEAPPSCVTRDPGWGPPADHTHGPWCPRADRPEAREVTLSCWEQVVGPLICFWIQTWDGKVLRAHRAACTHRVTLWDCCPVGLENRCHRLGPARLARGLQTTLSCSRGTQLPAGESYLTVTPSSPSPRAGHPGVCPSPSGPPWAGSTGACVLLTSDTQDLLKSQPRAGHPASGTDEGHRS